GEIEGLLDDGRHRRPPHQQLPPERAVPRRRRQPGQLYRVQGPLRRSVVQAGTRCGDPRGEHQGARPEQELLLEGHVEPRVPPRHPGRHRRSARVQRRHLARRPRAGEAGGGQKLQPVAPLRPSRRPQRSVRRGGRPVARHPLSQRVGRARSAPGVARQRPRGGRSASMKPRTLVTVAALAFAAACGSSTSTTSTAPTNTITPAPNITAPSAQTPTGNQLLGGLAATLEAATASVDQSSYTLQYRFQVLNDKDTLVEDSGPVSGTSYTTTKTLTPVAKYTWRVRAESQGYAGPW